LYSDVIYYLNYYNTIMPLKCDPAQKIVDDSGFSRTPDRLLKFYGTHVWWLEVFKTITSTCGSYYLGGSATAHRRPLSTRIPCATPDLLSKHPDTTIATYKRKQMKHLKQASETLAKTPKNI
jgi:hypothetical protein